MATTANCAILAQGVKTKVATTNNGAYFIPYNFSGAIVCSDGTSIHSQILTLDYTIKSTEPYVHRLLDEYKVDDWTDYQELKKLETKLVKLVIARYVSFSQQNYQWIWPILTIALVILYCATISGVIYCWCKTCRKIKKMPIRTINNVVKYVPTEAQEPITAATSTLQVNETQQLYPVMQGPTSILEIKKPINEAKTNRLRSADAVRAIFHPPEKETKRIQLDY